MSMLPIKITLEDSQFNSDWKNQRNICMYQMSEHRIQFAGLLRCLIYLEFKNVEVFEFTIELEITKMNKNLH